MLPEPPAGALSHRPSSPPPPPPPQIPNDFATGSLETTASVLSAPPSPILSAEQPLPSLPSISNVGAVPFSGSVNWNAIPGGFQPLPPIAGRSKRLYQLSQFHGGINQKSSPRDISDNECQEATNVTFSNVLNPFRQITLISHSNNIKVKLLQFCMLI